MNLSWTRTLIAVATLTSLTASIAAPAFANTQGQNNRNLWHVRHRLEADIDILQHDRRDYGGHRVHAVNDLQAARNEIMAAEETIHDQSLTPGHTVKDNEPGVVGQGQSNGNLHHVRRNVVRLISELGHDANDYGGHKAAAMGDLQQAREELTAAERYAKAHGY